MGCVAWMAWMAGVAGSIDINLIVLFRFLIFLFSSFLFHPIIFVCAHICICHVWILGYFNI
jgi:hypothetical protein